jgi:hypothetical protein
MANVTRWQNEVSDGVLKKSSLPGCRVPRMPAFADKLFWTPRQTTNISYGRRCVKPWTAKKGRLLGTKPDTLRPNVRPTAA